MKRLLPILFILLVAIPVWAEEETTADDQLIPPELPGETTDETPAEEAPTDEESTPTATPKANQEEQTEEGAEEPGKRSIVLDGAVTLNYVFDNSPESFIIKYSFHVEGEAAANVAVIKGDAEIKSDVEGFLAKWPDGECKLTVTIPKVPFEMTFRQGSEDRGNMNMSFKEKILETWESRCTFSDTPGKTFQTRGNPEEWLNKALQKARPPLKAIALKLSADEETTTTFTISKQTFKDPPLGTAEVEGTGVITIKPAGAE